MATGFKETGNGNPISANVFCADPTALEYNGRLYVYGSNDHQEFLANNKKGDNTYGNIKSIVVFSTDDMVNWTFHGTIDTKKICSGWTNNPWYVGYGVSWAPSVTWRHNNETDKDEFFLYFCNSSHGIGVLKAESPLGPWKSPNNRLMIHRDTPGATPCSAVFDPGVTVDENGVGWISFGGLDPVDGGDSFNPKNARIVKLKPNMTEIDGQPVRIPAPYHFEANELNVIGGKYVYTYCSNWAERKADEWNAYKSEHNINVNAPGGGTMCYMVSDNPLDPESWEFKGYYGPGVAGNNHSHLQKFQGKYYHIYHNHGSVLLDAMKKNGAVDASAGDYRSICVNKTTVNESTATVNLVTLNQEGAAQIKNVNPYMWQQAETMATCGGVNYEDMTNIKKNTKISTLGNDASENLQVKMKEGSWINVRKVDYGTNGAGKFTLRAKGTGTMELRNGTAPKTTVATIEFSSTEMAEQTFDIPVGKLKGVKNNLYLFVKAATDFYIDAWKFTAYEPTVITQETFELGKPNNDDYRYLDKYLGLKEYIDYEKYPNFKLGAGTTVNDYLQKSTVYKLTNANFTETVAGNAMKMASCVDGNGNMNFNTVKSYVNTATAAGLNVYGHTLAWHSQQAKGWLLKLLGDKPDPSGETEYTVVTSKDFRTSQSVGWRPDNAESTYGFTFMFDATNGLKVTTTKSYSWEVQFVAMSDISLTTGQTYKMTMTVKGSKSGKLDGRVGDWNGGANFSVNFTTDWQDVEVSITPTMGSSFMLLHVPNYIGDVYIKQIKFEGEQVKLVPQTAEEMHDTLVYAMDKWIKGMMEACDGKVKAWDLVNEPISGEDKDKDGNYDLQHFKGYETGTWDVGGDAFYWQDYMGDLEYVRQACRLARKYGPEDVKLFINDYNLESDWDDNKKLKSLINWIKKWEADGVTHIDGIGTQMHISYYENANLQNSNKSHITQMFQLMANSGKLVRVSELDMGYVRGSNKWAASTKTTDLTEEEHKKMADFYEWIIKEYFRIIPAAQHWGICQWCTTDSPTGSGWRGGEPVGIWDLDYYRKHVYAGFVRGLNGGEPTGIERIEKNKTIDTSKGIYNLHGMRLSATSLDELPSGLYIVNGKKVVKY
jgi:GH35 family endo-1,4-beta-xylanase